MEDAPVGGKHGWRKTTTHLTETIEQHEGNLDDPLLRT
jgi:hypothetical protein